MIPRRRCNKDRNHVEQQVKEDTCEKHGVFCCPECFDMTIPDDEESDEVSS